MSRELYKDRMEPEAYYGSFKHGFPFAGDIDAAIKFDSYEANTPVVVHDPNKKMPEISHTYRVIGRDLAGYLELEPDQHVLELDARTGMNAVEIITQHPHAYVLSRARAEGHFWLSLYKFNQVSEKFFYEQLEEKGFQDLVTPVLKKYWDAFRRETEPYSKRVKFFREGQEKQDLENYDLGSKIDFNPDGYEWVVVANYMHWSSNPEAKPEQVLADSFKRASQFIKPKGILLWNTASHFFNDAIYPSSDYGFRYNDFIGYVMEYLKKGGFDVKDFRKIAVPELDRDAVLDISARQGFDTEYLMLSMKAVDLQTLIKNHVPQLAKVLIANISYKDVEGMLEKKIEKAIEHVILDQDALLDHQHKYELVPYFRSVKIRD